MTLRRQLRIFQHPPDQKLGTAEQYRLRTTSPGLFWQVAALERVAKLSFRECHQASGAPRTGVAFQLPAGRRLAPSKFRFSELPGAGRKL